MYRSDADLRIIGHVAAPDVETGAIDGAPETGQQHWASLSDDEKLTDVMIGEAVLTLLKSDKPVSSNALINHVAAPDVETGAIDGAPETGQQHWASLMRKIVRSELLRLSSQQF
jgi:hypothetical protein